MPRLLLLLPTSTYRAADFLEAARVLGAEVIVASEQRQALAGVMGERALTVNCRRPEAAADAIVDIARRKPLDAVVPVDDQGVLAAALAAQRLGLAHNPPEAAAKSRDKAAMREALGAAAVPQPEYRVAGPDADVAALALDVGVPCVLKPVSLSGSRGVIRVDDPADAGATAGRIRAILAEAGEDPGGPLIVERYIPGQEVAVEGLLRGGALEVLAVFDKPDPLEGPYFEETIYVTPSRLAPRTLEVITRTTADAAAALGLVEGPIHAELRVDGERVWVLELAARSIGGLCSRSLRFGIGVSLEELILRHALGLPADDLTRESAASGVMMLPIPRAGVLEGVRGQDEARAVPGIAGLEITIAYGRAVTAPGGGPVSRLHVRPSRYAGGGRGALRAAQPARDRHRWRWVDGMRIGAALSTDPDPATAAEAAVQGARSQIGGAEISLAVVVASRQHAPSAEVALETVRIKAGPERVIGCVAETVVSGDREVEDGPAVAVWLACLPEPVETFHMEFVRTSEGDVLGGYRFEEAGPGPYLLIGDPFSFPTDLLLGHLNERVPGTVLMGGMASGGMRSGDTRLFLDDRVVDTGAIGARLPGIAIRALVSQGCRPIGNVYAVTRAEGNVIHELGGRPPLERLRELVATLSPQDRELVGRGLHVGRVIDEYKTELERGDFLIRGVAGVDPQNGALAVGDRIEVGETIQFHVRDAATADEDLRSLLEREAVPAAGALLFTCNGGGHAYSRSRITTRRSFRRSSGAFRWRDSTARGRSGRSAGRTSYTASPRR